MRIFTIWLLFVLVYAAGCRGEVWYSQTALFPQAPHVDIDSDDWLYMAEVKVSSKASGPLSGRSEKDIKVMVHDREGKNHLLMDKFSLVCSFIEPEIKWEEFETIKMELWEKLGKPHSAMLDQSRKRKMIVKLEYQWDADAKKFLRTKGHNIPSECAS